MKRLVFAFLALILLCPASFIAQTSKVDPEVSTVIAILTKSIEARTNNAGDEITLRTINDLRVGGQIMIPRGSKLIGQLVEVASKSKDHPETTLAFTIESAKFKEEPEIRLQAIVAALAAPRRDSLATDPTFGMMHSNEPKMVGGANSTASSGSLSPSSKSSSNAAVATANLQGKLDQPTVLEPDSQGAVDIEGLTVAWRLMTPPPVTVISTKAKNLKLELGTQMLLRMAPPRPAR